jgi:hypothetical protein
MKTLRIILFFVLGTIFTLHSFAQEIKKDKIAKVKMEVVDNEGNKKVIDTSFTVLPDQNYKEIIKQIKEKAGFTAEQMAEMKADLDVDFKKIRIEMDEKMKNFNKDSMHKQMMIIKENMHSGSENLKKALEDLKLELEAINANAEVMKKLEKAMQEFKNNQWPMHKELINLKMDEMHKYLDKNIKVMIFDGDEDNTLEWNDKDGKKVIVKKLDGGKNTIFFGEDVEIEKFEKADGEHRIIVKNLPKEAAKGEAIFISSDPHTVKHEIDKDGNVKVMQYTMKSNHGNDQEIELIVNTDGKTKKESINKFVMVSPANEKDIENAIAKGIYDGKAESLNQTKFSIEINDETTTLGASFEEKGKLIVQLFDSGMNQIWEKNEGKISGEWSVVIPGNLIKEKGKYFILFNFNKKLKLQKLVIK